MKQSLIRRKNRLRNLIYCEKTRELCRMKNCKNTFIRNRKITFSDLLLLTLNKQGRNTSFELRDFEVNKKGAITVNYSDEAYLKQRRQLNPEVFKYLNKNYLEDFYSEKKYIKKYKGYVVIAIDGSKEEIPNTKQNRAIFGTVIGGRGKSKEKVARALMSGAYDVYNKFFLDIQIDKARAYEKETAKKNIVECINISQKNKNLFIFDRSYPSIEMYEYIEEKNAKFLMRLSINDYVKERQAMKEEDEIVEIKYNHYRLYHFKQKFPEAYEKLKDKKGKKLRIINIKLKTGEQETLITNILDTKFTKEDFKELYNARWKIEEGYDSLKNKLKIEKFSGRLPVYIYQDVYAQVLVYNQIQDMLKESNERLKEKAKEKVYKNGYQINENKAIGLYKEMYIKIMLIEDSEIRVKEFDKLLGEMTKYVSVVRENRTNNKRHWTPSNKYRINHGDTF